MTHNDYLKARKIIEKATIEIEGGHSSVLDRLGSGKIGDLRQVVKDYRGMSVTASGAIDDLFGFCIKNGYALGVDFIGATMELHNIESLARMLSISFESSKSVPSRSDRDTMGVISDAISTINRDLY